MRFARNFHPEWGYLAPAPTFMRTARVAIVAAAVGATAGAGVVVPLIDRPAEISVAARTLVRPVEAVVSIPVGPSPAPLAQASTEKEPAAPALVVAGTPAEGAVGTESSRAALAPAAIAAPVESPAASDGAAARMTAELKPAAAPEPPVDPSAARKKVKAKRSISRDFWRDDTWRGGPLAILPGEYAMRGASSWADRDAWGERYRYR